jgi:uncharacterized membrane protein YpjA
VARRAVRLMSCVGMVLGIVANRSCKHSCEEEGSRLRVDLWTRFARWVIMSPVVWVVALADLGGAIAGYTYWYGSTILAAPWYYWVFVPDCPLAAMLMGAALLAFHFRRRWDLLGLLAVGACVKYGLWTVISWTVDFSRGDPLSLEGVAMAVSHFLLLIQALMLISLVRYRLLPVAVASLFLIGNDLVDYVAGQYPRLPALVGVGLMRVVAVSLTAATLAFWTVMTWLSAKRTRVAVGVAGVRSR